MKKSILLSILLSSCFPIFCSEDDSASENERSEAQVENACPVENNGRDCNRKDKEGREVDSPDSQEERGTYTPPDRDK